MPAMLFVKRIGKHRAPGRSYNDGDAERHDAPFTG